MAQRCAFVFFAIVFALGVGIVNGAGRPTVDSRSGVPAPAKYAELLRIVEEEKKDARAAETADAQHGGNGLLGTPTIHPCRGCNADDDIASIETALSDMSGEGINKLIVIATERSFSQRANLFDLYFKKTGKVLTDVLADTLGKTSDLFQGFEALFDPAAWRDAAYLYESMKGAGTDDAELNEIITSRTYRQLEIVRKVYKERFGTELTDDIAGDSWGVVETLLLKIVTTPRKTDFAPPQRVDELATALYDAGAGRWGRDDAVFIEIFSSESYSTLRSVFHAYEAKYQTTVYESVSSEFSRKARDLYMTLVKVILSPPQYFADLIYTDIAGAGTYERGLARHILARADIDLEEIKHAYKSKYKETVSDAVAADVSGDYLKLLLAAIKEEEPSKLNKENEVRPVQVA